MNTKYMLVTPWLSNLRDRAEAVLGSQASAWLATPNRNLGDRVPLDLAGDYFGAQMVIAELARPNAKRARVR